MKIGDVVMLQSGGPPMTVTALTATEFICSWFTASGTLSTAAFSREVLKPAKAEK